MLQFLPANAEVDPKHVARVAEEHALSPLAAEVLLARGLKSAKEIRDFLHPSLDQLHDPMLLPDLPQAVARIRAAMERGERCCVYGDYDADGVSASALLYEYLLEAGMDVCCHIPEREGEGYGMHEDAVRRLAAEGVRLIITVDNGISAVQEVALAQELGVDVIVTDHHQCPPELPACIALVNPMRGGYPFPRLSGAGVAFKLLEALAGRERALKALPFAALATVADVVPLVGENRVIAALGMERIKDRPGLAALLEVAGAAAGPVGGDTLAYRLAPRINAAGRMGDPMRAFRLLLAKDLEEAMPLALILNEENARRQQTERHILAAAEAMLAVYGLAERRGILLHHPDWHPGVIGIVASRLVGAYHRPALLFHEENGMLIGSGRSIPGINLVDCLEACKAHLLKYGGHAQAAGMTLAREAFPAFQAAFEAYLREHIPADAFLPKASYSLEAALNGLTIGMARELMRLAPFGEGNPEPVLCTRGVSFENVQRIGNGGAHLRARAAAGSWKISLVGFGQGSQAEALSRPGERHDILYTLQADSYQDIPRLQLMLKSARCRSVFDEARYLTNRRANFFDAFYKNVLYNGAYNLAGLTLCADMDTVLMESLLASPTGTLILCCTPSGAARLRALLLEKGLDERLDARFDDGTAYANTAYNLLLLAPHAASLEPALRLYGRVFLYDCPAHAPSAQAFAREGLEVCAAMDEADMRDFLSAMPPGREAMGRYYRAFMGALRKQGTAMRRIDLCRLPELQRTTESADLALTVFEELGFFETDARSGLVRPGPGRESRPLTESAVYAFAQCETE